MRKSKMKIVICIAIFLILISVGFVQMNTNFLYMKNSVEQNIRENNELGDNLNIIQNSNNILNNEDDIENYQVYQDSNIIIENSNEPILSNDQIASPESDISIPNFDSINNENRLILRQDPLEPKNPKNPPQPLLINNTYVNPIIPYYQDSSPADITATGPSDLDSVSLYYRWSPDNQTWDNNSNVIDPITVDNTSSSQGGSVSTVSWTHTVGNYNNRILVVCSGVEDAGTADYPITGIDFNNNGLTKAHSDFVLSSNNYLTSSEIWYILNPEIGSFTLRVNYTGPLNDCEVGAISLYNVSQQGPEAVNSSTNEAINQISTDITTTTDGSIIIDTAHCGNAQTFTQGSGQTEFYEEVAASSGAAGSYKILPTSGTTTMWENVSNTAEFGGLTRRDRVITEESREAMKDILKEIQKGEFTKEWTLENQAGAPMLNRIRDMEEELQIEKVGTKLRKLCGLQK